MLIVAMFRFSLDAAGTLKTNGKWMLLLFYTPWKSKKKKTIHKWVCLLFYYHYHFFPWNHVVFIASEVKCKDFNQIPSSTCRCLAAFEFEGKLVTRGSCACVLQAWMIMEWCKWCVIIFETYINLNSGFSTELNLLVVN